ncbi:MAG: hypothetical protein ACPG8F_01980 [Flavobacteriaceae bacterium]
MRFLKKIAKILVLFSLILATLFMYFDKALPQGEKGPAADQLAQKMLQALNHNAFKDLNYIEWTFSSRGKGRSYQWHKAKGTCTVVWDSISVNLNLTATNKSTVEVNEQPYQGEKKRDFIYSAEAKFNNDSFWLVAPYKVFDKGVERRLVKRDDGQEALLVTYTTGGTTPGDSYLWLMDEHHRPKAFQMWVDIIPIGGLTASWDDWIKTPQGVILPQSHQLLFLDLAITDLKTAALE